LSTFSREIETWEDHLKDGHELSRTPAEPCPVEESSANVKVMRQK